VSNASTHETHVDGLMASTSFALNGLVGCGHVGMDGLMARRICPLATLCAVAITHDKDRYHA
jgi:hypothetical protein